MNNKFITLDQKQQIIIQKMLEYEIKYYEILLNKKSLTKVLDKYNKLDDNNSNQLSKEANDEILKINYQLDIIETNFNAIKEEYDKLETENNEN